MTQRTSEEISAELAEFRTARAKLVNGERVTSVGRGERRMNFAEVSLADIDTAIQSLERELQQSVTAESGSGQRRRPMGLAYRN